MARKLPWKRDSEASSSASAASHIRSTPRVESPVPRSATSIPQNVLRTPRSRRHERVFDSDPIRSPSTSPPPARPEEKFMILGALNDDKYRMVEDEFLHMAQRFTAHLHRAEYDRLKALAKTQNAATIREIERPVVANLVPTQTTRRRQASLKRVTKQRKTLQDTGVSGGDERNSLPWNGSSLRGLMEVPREESKAIIPFTSCSSTTRAAAGFDATRSSPPSQQSARPTRDPVGDSSKKMKLETSSRRSGGDSNETPARRTSQMRAFQTPTHSTSSPRQPPYSSSSVVRNVAGTSDSSTIRSNRSRNAFSADKKEGKRRASFLDSDDDDDDPFGLNERRLNRKKSREQFKKPEMKTETKPEVKATPKKVSLDTIPTFL